MRILITSNSHPAYNRTGEIVRPVEGEKGVFVVVLESTGEEVEIREGQFNPIRDKSASGK